jgi:hypothetical protein
VPPENIQIPPPAMGDIVTFSYESQSRREVPINATIYRVRRDIAWLDVVNQYRRDEPHSGSMSFSIHILFLLLKFALLSRRIYYTELDN